MSDLHRAGFTRPGSKAARHSCRNLFTPRPATAFASQNPRTLRKLLLVTETHRPATRSPAPAHSVSRSEWRPLRIPARIVPAGFRRAPKLSNPSPPEKLHLSKSSARGGKQFFRRHASKRSIRRRQLAVVSCSTPRKRRATFRPFPTRPRRETRRSGRCAKAIPPPGDRVCARCTRRPSVP